MAPSSRLITECGSCGSNNLVSVLNLGYSPPACSMRPVGERLGEETFFPLELLRCEACTLVQLSCIVDPKIVFHKEYPYSSGNTKALRDNFVDLAIEVGKSGVYFGAETLVVDIGANDGTLLSNFEGCRRVAVDPTDQVQKAADRYDIDAWQCEFGSSAGEDLREEHGTAKVVTACNVLAHVEYIGDVLDGVYELLADDGVFVTENHHLASIVDGLQWDTVYHEHLRYYTPWSLTLLLRQHGFAAFRVQNIFTHGGSFRTFARKRHAADATCSGSFDWAPFADRVANSRREIRRAIATQRGNGSRVWGVGSAARATTVINYCGLTSDDVECVCEVASSDKIGRYMPGTDIEVVDEARLFDEQPEYAFLFSWHVADDIIPKLREKGYRGTFIVPLPYLTFA